MIDGVGIFGSSLGKASANLELRQHFAMLLVRILTGAVGKVTRLVVSLDRPTVQQDGHGRCDIDGKPAHRSQGATALVINGRLRFDGDIEIFFRHRRPTELRAVHLDRIRLTFSVAIIVLSVYLFERAGVFFDMV